MVASPAQERRDWWRGGIKDAYSLATYKWSCTQCDNTDMAMHSRAGPVVVVVAAAVVDVVASATLRRQVLVECLQGADYRLGAAFRRPVPVGRRTGRQQRPSTLCHTRTSHRRHQHNHNNDRYNIYCMTYCRRLSLTTVYYVYSAVKAAQTLQTRQMHNKKASIR